MWIHPDPGRNDPVWRAYVSTGWFSSNGTEYLGLFFKPKPNRDFGAGSTGRPACGPIEPIHHSTQGWSLNMGISTSYTINMGIWTFPCSLSQNHQRPPFLFASVCHDSLRCFPNPGRRDFYEGSAGWISKCSRQLGCHWHWGDITNGRCPNTLAII